MVRESRSSRKEVGRCSIEARKTFGLVDHREGRVQAGPRRSAALGRPREAARVSGGAGTAFERKHSPGRAARPRHSGSGATPARSSRRGTAAVRGWRRGRSPARSRGGHQNRFPPGRRRGAPGCSRRTESALSSSSRLRVEDEQADRDSWPVQEEEALQSSREGVNSITPSAHSAKRGGSEPETWRRARQSSGSSSTAATPRAARARTRGGPSDAPTATQHGARPGAAAPARPRLRDDAWFQRMASDRATMWCMETRRSCVPGKWRGVP